jgi:hypothetical protein
MAFPWKALREQARRSAPPRDGDQWRVNFSRVQWKHEVLDGRYVRVPQGNEDNWVWSPQGVIDMHRPERWGYVQFAGVTFGEIAVRPDPTARGRELLHDIYYAERAHRRAHGRWGRTLAELGVVIPDDVRLLRAPLLEVTESLFQATLFLKPGPGVPARICIRQDALVWTE